MNKTTNLFEDKIKHIESEQEDEFRELQERLQFFKAEKAALEEELHQKLSRVKNEHQDQIK